jgi:tetratricopeptide (TPR) repeat protein
MIAALWLKSGSDTVDLMMEWTQQAVKDKNYPLALDYLDRIVTLKPDYVEGWNTRATVYYLREDYGRALADIEKTLRIEPRHFGALTGLGTIMREIGDDKRALEVYRKVLVLDPHLESVKDAIKELSDQGVEGRDL